MMISFHPTPTKNLECYFNSNFNVLKLISFLGVETFDCDREVAEIVSGGNNDGENNNGVSLSGILEFLRDS